MDDLTLAEFGLGGSPALEAGLGTEGISTLVKVDKVFSRDLAGICKDDKFGRLDCGIKEVPSLFSFRLHVYKTIKTQIKNLEKVMLVSSISCTSHENGKIVYEAGVYLSIKLSYIPEKESVLQYHNC